MLPAYAEKQSIEDVEGARRSLSGALESTRQCIAEVADEAGPARGPLRHILLRTGKLLRPRLVLLAASIVAREPCYSPGLAAAAELIHSASLLHDDVIDEGMERRGAPTTRVAYSNAVAVLAGDHCLARAVDLIRAVDTEDTLAESLQTVRNLVAGELLQLETAGTLVLDEERYRRVCELKTASLFVWSARAGARFGGGTDQMVDDFGRFAQTLGIAFQIRDDLLDLVGTEGFGKRLHDDIREGRSTLPVILAAQERPRIIELFEDPTPQSIEEIASEIQASGALVKVSEEVTTRLTDAFALLDAMPPSPFRTLLRDQMNALTVA